MLIYMYIYICIYIYRYWSRKTASRYACVPICTDIYRYIGTGLGGRPHRSALTVRNSLVFLPICTDMHVYRYALIFTDI